jgi:small-conductance mechanosensitive channel
VRKRPIGTLVLFLFASIFLVACANGTVSDVPPGVGTTPDAGPAGAEPPATGLLDEALPTRTPAPTATPGLIAREVEAVTTETGMAWTYFLGLSTTDWINLGISLAAVGLGYLLGTILIRRILPAVARRTTTELDDKFLDRVGSDLRWLLVVIVMNWSTRRLGFVNPDLKDLLSDLYFILGWGIALQAAWRLIDLGGRWYHERSIQAGREEELGPIIVLLVRGCRVVLLVTGLVVLLSHFGANVTVIAVAVALGALALSLGARDTIADAIAGFIILVDRPFRVGDRIEIEGEGTWGDVVDIGLRTTRIRSRDNRLVIMPNSLIGRNKVNNYTYPDPSYRIRTNVQVAYGTDIERAEQLIVDAVRQVPGIVPDAEIEVLYDEMGDSAMVLGIRWWIESYVNARRSRDQVHRALQTSFDDAGIEMPYPTQSLHLYNESEVTDDSAT